MRLFLPCLCALGLALSVAAQDATVYFSPRYTETPASGRGGFISDAAAPCLPTPVFGNGFVIESAIANPQGVCYVTPGVLNTTLVNSLPAQMTNDFVEVSNFPQFNLYLGDMDNDGVPHESTNFRGVDAMYVPTPSVGRPNNIHEMFVSCWSGSSGSAGYLGATIEESDMVLLPAAGTAYPVNSPAGTPVYFIRRADWITLLGFVSTSSGLDVNAFTVDQSSGDIYCSFDNSTITGAMLITSPGGSPATTTITRGDIIRIPAAAYTPSGPYGVVSNPVSGFAERVYSSTDVDAMVANAGGTNTTSGTVNVYSLSVDSSGGISATPSGFATPDLLFTIYNQGGQSGGFANPSAAAIYTTSGGGAYANLNGVIMDQPASIGMNDVSFNNNYYAGALDAMSVVRHTPNLDPMADRPVHLDTFPTNGVITDPAYTGRITCYVSGLPPGGQAGVFARLDTIGAGGFVSRCSLAGSVQGYPDLYVDPFGVANQSCVLAPANSIVGNVCQNPIAQTFFNNPSSGTATPDPNQSINPVSVFTDPSNGAQNGDLCFELDLTASLPPGTMPANPPLVITIQVLDFSTVRLSSPIALQLN